MGEIEIVPYDPETHRAVLERWCQHWEIPFPKVIPPTSFMAQGTGLFASPLLFVSVVHQNIAALQVFHLIGNPDFPISRKRALEEGIKWLKGYAERAGCYSIYCTVESTRLIAHYENIGFREVGNPVRVMRLDLH